MCMGLLDFHDFKLCKLLNQKKKISCMTPSLKRNVKCLWYLIEIWSKCSMGVNQCVIVNCQNEVANDKCYASNIFSVLLMFCLL